MGNDSGDPDSAQHIRARQRLNWKGQNRQRLQVMRRSLLKRSLAVGCRTRLPGDCDHSCRTMM